MFNVKTDYFVINYYHWGFRLHRKNPLVSSRGYLQASLCCIVRGIRYCFVLLESWVSIKTKKSCNAVVENCSEKPLLWDLSHLRKSMNRSFLAYFYTNCTQRFTLAS